MPRTRSKPLPELSRFEMQCLRRLWARGEASVREIHRDMPQAPSYSTVRKIVERLEQKGAVRRVRLEGRAWVYGSDVSSAGMIRKEVRRLIDLLFDGRGSALVAHLASTDEITMQDLREIEARILGREGKEGAAGGSRGGRSR